MDALLVAGGVFPCHFQPGITAKSQHKKVDAIEEWMVATYPRVDSPVEHFFTDDQYIRKIFMRAGSLITSKIHLTRHPFFVLQGKCAVWDAEKGVHIVKAPYFGITEPGTRRILLIGEDCIWATVHAKLQGETVEDIERRIIEPRSYNIVNNDEFLQLDGGPDIAALLAEALKNENV